MNRKELLETVLNNKELNHITKKDADRIITATFETIKKTVKKGEDVSLVGFGTWLRAKRAARTGVNPATGEIQGQCSLATKSEVNEAIGIAAKAQPAWAAVNPQRRSRIMMKFVELLNRDMQKLAEALSREHGKTLPDAAGDVQQQHVF